MKARYKISCAVAAILSGCGTAIAADVGSQPQTIETVVVSAERRDQIGRASCRERV